MKTKEAVEILDKIKDYIGNPVSELNYSNPFEFLISVLLSAQTTDKNVNSATKELFKIASTPELMLALGQEKIESYVYSCGFYKNKASNVIKTCNKLITSYNSKVPNTFEDLLKLNGVGRKTANLVLAEIYNIPGIAVDTHVFRVSNRLGLVKTDNVLDTEMQLRKLLPKKRWKESHYTLLLFGRRYCKAKKFDCKNCILKSNCKYYKNIKE